MFSFASLLRALAVTAALAVVACSSHATTETTTTSDAATTAPVADATDAAADIAATAAPEDVSSAPAVVAVVSPAAAATPTFTDIADADGADAIRQLAAIGVFDTMTGAFRPSAPISRGLYVRWLVKANNAIFVNAPDKRIRAAETNDSSFVDVTPSTPDFKSIQGMSDAGYVIGIDAKHFAPARNLTREELIAILISRDNGSKPLPKAGPPSTWNYSGSGVTIPVDLTDRGKISKPYWGAFQVNDGYGNSYALKELKRVFGSSKVFHPQQLATRQDAAIALQLIDGASPPKLAASSP